jgi:hypothetical protein
MSKKPFNASSITKSIYGNNNLEVTFLDALGAKQVVNLCPEARHRLMLALLTRPPLRPGVADDLIEPERILNIQGIRRFVLPNGNPGLELILGQKMSIGITFPPGGVKAFQDALETFYGTWKTPLPH